MNDDIEAVRNAIRKFIERHRSRPFGILREIGVQSELKHLTDHYLVGRTHVMARLVDEPSNTTSIEVSTDRVRLEAKIQLPPNEESEQEFRHDRTDLILYRAEGVSLFRHPSGPGDVVYKTSPEAVLAAVEIKASPSVQSSLRVGYALDIVRLLRLRTYGIAGFFVLLDKSADLYREAGCQLKPMTGIDWLPSDNPCALSKILKVQDLQWGDVVVAREAPAAHTNYIEIWDVSGAEEKPRRLFAYRAPMALQS